LTLFSCSDPEPPAANDASRADSERVVAAPTALTGRVTDPAGRPIAAAEVIALDRRAWEDVLVTRRAHLGRSPRHALEVARAAFARAAENLARTRTDDAGAFAMRDLAPGPYRVLVFAPDYLPATNGRVLIRADSSAPTARHEVRLAPARTISGRVIDAAGAPVAGATVAVDTCDAARVAGVGKVIGLLLREIDATALVRPGPVVTAADGSFRVAGLEPLAHDVAVRADGWLDRVARAVRPGTRDLVVRLERAAVVRGRVRAADGAAVSNATVVIRVPERDPQLAAPLGLAPPGDPLGERTREGRTDAAGRFALAVRAAGTYEVAIDAANLAPFATEVSVDAADVDLGDVALEKLDPKNTTKRAPETAQVAGVVLEGATRRPVANATVIVGDDDRTSTATDADGRFRIAGVARHARGAGGEPIGLRVECSGYETAWHPLGPNALAPNANDSDASRIEVLLATAPRIHGRVLDDGGDGVSRARVELQVPGLPSALALIGPRASGMTTTTDATGAFSLDVPGRAAARVFDVVAEHPGYARTRRGPITPQALGKDGMTLEIRLARGMTFAGKITDTTGTAVVGAQVEAYRAVDVSLDVRMTLERLPPPRGDLAYTDADGRFAFRNFEPGAYHLRIAAHGYATMIRRGIAVEEGSATHDFALDAGETIAGRVVDQDGAAVSTAEIVVVPATDAARGADADGNAAPVGPRRPSATRDQAIAMAQADDDGRYALPHLSSEPCSLVAHAAGYALGTVGPLRAGEGTSDVEMVLLALAGVDGRVIDAETDEPVREFRVAIERREDGRFEPWESDDGAVGGRRAIPAEWRTTDGVFRLDELPAGEYRISTRAEDYATTVTRFVVRPRAENAVCIALGPGARVDGTVVRADTKQPIVGVRVRATRTLDGRPPIPREERRPVSTDAAGRFSLRGLSDGEYRLTASHPDFWIVTADAARFDVPFAAPGGTAAPVPRFAMLPAGHIEGTVRGLPPIDRRRAAYYVVAERESDEPAADAPSVWLSRRDGGFRLNALRPGRYRVALEKRLFDRSRSERGAPSDRELGIVDVEAGATARLDADASTLDE